VNENLAALAKAAPRSPDWETDFEALSGTPIAYVLASMKRTPQNPLWHGEGDVLTHTKLVLRELSGDERYRRADERKKLILFTAALLHDIGKTRCTRLDNGVPISPYHSKTGAVMARQLLWKHFGLCGDESSRSFRETVCFLIRCHSLPPNIINDEDCERTLVKAAAHGELAPEFSLKMLDILTGADMKGRICDTLKSSLDNLEFCFSLAKETGVYNAPMKFVSPYSELAYFDGKIPLNTELYDSSWGEVVIMSGLPGTGKDTWIKENLPGLPEISPDDIRRQLKISPTDPQGAVFATAREQAKEYLRRREPFVWNATNITAATRARLTTLISGYGAATRIVFLETPWETELARNSARPDSVPESAIETMLEKLEIPEKHEARTVEWRCV